MHQKPPQPDLFDAPPPVTNVITTPVERLEDFDGATYQPHLDHKRLGKQLKAVLLLMQDHQWHTLSEASIATGYPEASVSARLRDLRKEKFGAYTLEHRRRGDGGTWEYRLLPKDAQ